MKTINKSKSIAFYTLGCRLNQSETASLQNSFTTDAYRIVNIKEPADIVVINTCTVTENGDTDTRRLVNRVSRLNPQTQIALIGCQAQVQKEKLLKLSNVRWVVGNAVKMDLKNIVSNLDAKDEPKLITPAITKEPFTIKAPSIDTTHTRANLKIQDGCDFFCSFCEIPFARGRARSREFNDILKEANLLVQAGHKELVLTGINIGTYRYQTYTITDVIEALEQIPQLARIRISSIEPTTIPTGVIDKMSKKSKLCRHLHIPLQSGDDKVLKAMKRTYTVKEFSHFINNAYAKVDGLCIGTDVIAGFPAEGEGHFQNTVEILKKLPIHYFHTFSYSKRYLAKSKNYEQENIPQIIAQRSKTLRTLSEKKRTVFYDSLIGSTQKVLFETNKRGFLEGLTDNYARISIASSNILPNAFKSISIRERKNQRLLGTLENSSL